LAGQTDAAGKSAKLSGEGGFGGFVGGGVLNFAKK